MKREERVARISVFGVERERVEKFAKGMSVEDGTDCAVLPVNSDEAAPMVRRLHRALIE